MPSEVSLRPLPLPEFHLLHRQSSVAGAHKRAAHGLPQIDGLYLERTEEAVKAFGSGVSPTRFQFYFIGLVSKSRATCSTGLASFQLRPRTAFFVSPGQIHSSRDWTTRDRGYALSFSEAFFVENLTDKETLRHSSLFNWERSPFLQLDSGDDKQLRALFASFEAEWKRKPRPSVRALRLLLQLIIVRFEEAAERCVCPVRLDANGRIYQRFRSALETRFRTEKSPANYAAQLGVHPNHLATAVRAASGLPPGEWIRARVILEAQCLLGNTTRAVKEVAAELGYDDEAYFSRLFKKAVGVSPRDYQLSAT